MVGYDDSRMQSSYEEPAYKFRCWYEYSGMETEGNVFTEPEFFIDAWDEHEAMWEYHKHLENKPFLEKHPTPHSFKNSGDAKISRLPVP